MDTIVSNQQYPLDKKSIVKKTLWAWSFFIFNIGGLSILAYFQPGGLQVVEGFKNALPPILAQSFLFNSGWLSLVYFLLIMLVIIYPYQILFYQSYHYEINSQNLIIKKGVFSVTQISIPFDRIQDVYIDQDILDRLLGLYDLHFSNASAYSARASHIDGLGKEAADTIRTLVLNQIKLNNHSEGKNNAN
ncbi:MAG: rane-flanked domain [Gammaproteobacteria bacterium]|jgi:membrane protein YdbS with pleckstrin-like domain|nr:rane-flanked domain [Gammaproteobacteria bacterium]